MIDEDGDEVLRSCKLRYSDHGDRYGSDVSIEINRPARAIARRLIADHLTQMTAEATP